MWRKSKCMQNVLLKKVKKSNIKFEQYTMINIKNYEK